MLQRVDHFELQKDITKDHYLAIIVGQPAEDSSFTQEVYTCIFDHIQFRLEACVKVYKVLGKYIGFGLVVPGDSIAIEAVYEQDGTYRQIQYGLKYQTLANGSVMIIPDKEGMLHLFDPVNILEIKDPIVSMPTPSALKV